LSGIGARFENLERPAGLTVDLIVELIVDLDLKAMQWRHDA